MIWTLIILLFVSPSATGRCDEVDGKRHMWTAAERAETFRVVRATCEVAGAADFVCAGLDAITWRESRGKASEVHTRGPNELGYGAHGVSWRFWRKRIPNAKPADFCDPRQSALVVLSMWQTFHRRGAVDLVGLQRSYSGRRPDDDSHHHKDNAWCSLLRNRGVDCRRVLEPGDLGRPIERSKIRALARTVTWKAPA